MSTTYTITVTLTGGDGELRPERITFNAQTYARSQEVFQEVRKVLSGAVRDDVREEWQVLRLFERGGYTIEHKDRSRNLAVIVLDRLRKVDHSASFALISVTTTNGVLTVTKTHDV